MSTFSKIFPVFLLFLFLILLNSCGEGNRGEAAMLADVSTSDSSRLFKLIREDPLPAQLSFMEMRLEPFVFNSSQFPAANFADPALVRSALGDYKISTTYYDAAYQQTTTADKQGRYGAVVNVDFASGVKMNRYYTLYHYNGEFSRHLDWWRWAAHDPKPVRLAMPEILGVSAAAQQKYADDIGVFIRFGFYEDLLKRSYAARLLAGLQDSKDGDNIADVTNNIIVKDRQWWIGMKQKLHPVAGFGNRAATGPEMLTSNAAPVLSTGDAGVARMQTAVTAQLDKTLAEWAKSSGEGFTVLLARDGKIFYNKAFGQRDGKTLTVNDQSHIASINKVYTSILLMMCVERKLVSLDDDITKYFPTLKDVKLNKPITIRHLATHTSGLPDLTLDELNDLEEVIKPILPYVKVGGEFSYTETGYSLIGKILEIVTGKTIAQVMKEWLIQPLKLNTRVEGAASDAWSTSMDLAKVGQLLLNKGTYGNVKYFSPATFEAMLPGGGAGVGGMGIGISAQGGDASYKPPPVAQIERVINEVRQLGFNKLYGHGASSGTIFSIDPANNLVIVMARNQRGKDFEQNNLQFMRTVGSNMAR